ncbi:MAG TPA: hypothetical protein VMU24_00090 [Candidatus Acidoferrales bacterium]|nr:hypothetical protein [Candidatus Acidoferrales bacterium]
MQAYDDNTNLQRAIACINLNRNERQKCVLLRSLGEQIRETSRVLILETERLRNDSIALREKSNS